MPSCCQFATYTIIAAVVVVGIQKTVTWWLFVIYKHLLKISLNQLMVLNEIMRTNNGSTLPTAHTRPHTHTPECLYTHAGWQRAYLPLTALSFMATQCTCVPLSAVCVYCRYGWTKFCMFTGQACVSISPALHRPFTGDGGGSLFIGFMHPLLYTFCAFVCGEVLFSLARFGFWLVLAANFGFRIFYAFAIQWIKQGLSVIILQAFVLWKYERAFH